MANHGWVNCVDILRVPTGTKNGNSSKATLKDLETEEVVPRQLHQKPPSKWVVSAEPLMGQEHT
jgi:hypothetical protein